MTTTPEPDFPWTFDAATINDLTLLHPDLQEYVEHGGPLGPALKHPLVFSVFGGIIPAHVNAQYEHKKKLVEECLARRDYEGALVYYERPHRMTTLGYWVAGNMLTQQQLRKLLKWVWVDTEYPVQFGYDILEALFERAGFLSDGPRKPKTDLVIYRGVHEVKHKRGISWTTDLDKARWFAKRLNSGNAGHTYSAVTAPSGVLAMFHNRNESEVVVRRSSLRDVKEV